MKFALILTTLLTTSALAFAAEKTENQTVKLSVAEKGFEPNSIDVKPGVPVTLKVTRKTDATCATQVQIPSQKIKKDLPLNKEVSIEIGKLEKGEIRFACGMNMLEGKIITR
ncbi:MAG: cupredoxin domain-containing protein [Bdellovibrionales bacterium]